jgi:hypothetical protein
VKKQKKKVGSIVWKTEKKSARIEKFARRPWERIMKKEKKKKKKKKKT